MIGNDELETRIVDSEPDKLPDGFYVVKYSGNSLHQISNGTLKEHDVSASQNTLNAVTFRLTTKRVRAGVDSFCVEVPFFAGESIDVKYQYNERPASIAYSFVQLDDKGRGCINVDAAVPWGDIQVVGVRSSGSLRWHSTNAEIEVLPPPVLWSLKSYLQRL
jgi:hypothetical protein